MFHSGAKHSSRWPTRGRSWPARSWSMRRRARSRCPGLRRAPMGIDGAHVELSYSGETRRFEIAPSVLTWGDSRVQFAGSIVHVSQGPDGPGWSFDIKSTEGWLAAEPPDLQRAADRPARRTRFSGTGARPHCAQPVPAQGRRGRDQRPGRRVRRGRCLERSARCQDRADASCHLQDVVAKLGRARHPRLGVAKIGARQSAGWAFQGCARLGSRRMRIGRRWGRATACRLHLKGPISGWRWSRDGRQLEIPRGLLRLEGRAVEFTVPEASMAAADGRKLSLKGNLPSIWTSRCRGRVISP